MSKPTPRPWKTESDSPLEMILTGANGESVNGIQIWLDDACNDLNPLRRANAAHIVKCVNMHDEMVELLTKIANTVEGALPDMHDECMRLLSKTEAE